MWLDRLCNWFLAAEAALLSAMVTPIPEGQEYLPHGDMPRSPMEQEQDIYSCLYRNPWLDF